MKRSELISEIRRKKSFLCIGLDTDIQKIPSHLLKEKDPIFAFNKAIIEATSEYCVAYKPNLAFYEAEGSKGWDALAKTMEIIPDNIFTIADAKRGDIGNTCHQYAKAFFKEMNFDSITLAPYMGKDSISPFLEYPDKWAIVLALTSNPSADDFQKLYQPPLYQKVLEVASSWGTEENMMFVTGATQASYLEEIRRIVPHHFLLVPGVGAQGGSLEEVFKYGANKDCSLLVNSSRGIIYSSAKTDFAEKAGNSAALIQSEMEKLLISVKF